MTFQVDTGATVNTLPARYADNIKPTTRKLKMWNNTEAAPLGICHTVVKNPKNKKTYSIEFVVVSDNYKPLLGYKTAKKLQLMKINEQNIEKVATVSPVEQHPDTFDGKLGALPGKVLLQVDETIHPTVMPTRRIPIAVRPKLKAELDRMTRNHKGGRANSMSEPTCCRNKEEWWGKSVHCSSRAK